MRDGIARALVWALRLVFPSRGKHVALPHEPHAEPTPSNPWSQPWTGPSAAQVRSIFGAEEALRLTPVQRERRFAVEFAALGIEYPYRYPGDQFTTREASVDRFVSPPPSVPDVVCCGCGRLTGAPIEIADAQYVCPDCLYKLPMRATRTDEYRQQ